MAHFYDVGTRAWQTDPEEGWISSEVEEKKVLGETVRLVFRLVNGEVKIPCAFIVRVATTNFEENPRPEQLKRL